MLNSWTLTRKNYNRMMSFLKNGFTDNEVFLRIDFLHYAIQK